MGEGDQGEGLWRRDRRAEGHRMGLGWCEHVVQRLECRLKILANVPGARPASSRTRRPVRGGEEDIIEALRQMESD